MPSLNVIFTGDARQLEATFARMEAMMVASAKRQRDAIKHIWPQMGKPNIDNTIFNKFVPPKSAATDYINFWVNAEGDALNAVALKRREYLARKQSIMGTMGSGMAPGFAKLIEQEAAIAVNDAAGIAALATRKVAMTTLARSGGFGITSESGHKYGGKGGVVSEIAVIGHELLQGRGTGRILGSVSILAQRLGLLGKLIKSTAAEEIAAAHAEAKLSKAMAVTWYQANRKAEATVAAGVASGLSKEQATLNAAAEIKEAESALIAAEAQKVKAAATIESAEVAATAATVSLGPIGWLLVSGIALTAVLVGLAFHFHTLAVRARNLAEIMNPLKKKFTEQAKALSDSAKEHQEYLDWLKDIGKEHETLPQKIEEVIKKMRAQAAAEKELAQLRGASKKTLEEMDEKELRAELEMLQTAQKKAQAELDDAKTQAAQAEKKRQAFDKSDLTTAEKHASKLGEMLDAAQEAMEKTKIHEGPQYAYTPGSSYPTLISSGDDRAANENDLLTFKVGDKEITTSVADAKKAFKEATDKANALAEEEKKLADILSDSKKTTEEKDRAVQEFHKKIQETTDELDVKKQYGQKIAALQNGKTANDLNANQRIGAFAFSYNTQIDLQRAANKSLASIDAGVKALQNKTNGVPGYGGN